jgi:hypothetical protein
MTRPFANATSNGGDVVDDDGNDGSRRTNAGDGEGFGARWPDTDTPSFPRHL